MKKLMIIILVLLSLSSFTTVENGDLVSVTDAVDTPIIVNGFPTNQMYTYRIIVKSGTLKVGSKSISTNANAFASTDLPIVITCNYLYVRGASSATFVITVVI